MRSLIVPILLLAGLLLTQSPSADAAITSNFKGSDWKEWTEVRRYSFVWGFRDGSNAAANQVFEELQMQGGSESQRKASKRVGVAASIEQIVRGIDAVYADYRNANLPLWEVTEYVIDSIGGYKDQAYLDVMRKHYNRPE